MNALIITISHFTRMNESFNRELKLLPTRQVGRGVIRGVSTRPKQSAFSNLGQNTPHEG